MNAHHFIDRNIIANPLQLSIPCCSICGLQRPFPSIPEDRAQLKPLLTAGNRVHGALVAKVNVRTNGQALSILIRQDDGACGTRLTDDVCCAGVIQEAVVNTAGVPGIDALGTTEGRVSDERVATAVVIAGIVVSAVVVLLKNVLAIERAFQVRKGSAYLGPVQFVVRNPGLVEPSKQAQNMGVNMQLAQVLAVLI